MSERYDTRAREATPVRVRRLELEGRRVTYREAGAGAPVVVASGLGLSGRFYDRNFPAFAAAGLRLIVPDLPGFGGSRGGRRGLGVAETRDFLLAFTRAVGVAGAIWVGHSIGAQAALQVAVHAPHRARGIVLVGPTGEPGSGRLLKQAWALARESVRVPPAVVARVLSDYVRTSPLSYIGTWIRHARDRPQQRLSAVQCPALILVGTRDPVVSADYLELLLRRLRHSRLERIAGGTHALPRSRAAEFNSAVIAFCRELERPVGAGT
ncbi:MAG TPA: alpha/beta hydrolase [Longimicrobiales bacterium]|nr:alpha/beta hydrolase [Longimicrobiales bacterium]